MKHFALLIAWTGIVLLLCSCEIKENIQLGESDGDAQEGERENREFVYPDTCLTDAECPPQFPRCIYSFCRSETVCTQTDECTRDSDCGAGWYCSEADQCSCMNLVPDGLDGDGERERESTVCLKGPCAAWGPDPINFGMVDYGNQAVMKLNVENTGVETLVIYHMDFNRASDPDFSWKDGVPPTNADMIEIAPDEIRQFEVLLSPSGPPQGSGQIDVISNAENVPQGKFSVELTRYYGGSTYLTVDPDTFYHDFGMVVVDAPAALERKIIISNYCESPEQASQENRLLSIGPIAFDPVDPHDFSIDTTDFNPNIVHYIRQCESLEFIVNFLPKTSGDKTVDLVIPHDATDYPQNESPARITFNGRGVVPCFTVSPDPINFGEVTVGVPVTMDVTITSACGGTVEMTGIEWKSATPPADFEIFDPGGAANAILPNGNSVTFKLSYTPGEIGEDENILVFKQKYKGRETQVTVIGVGLAESL